MIIKDVYLFVLSFIAYDLCLHKEYKEYNENFLEPMKNGIYLFINRKILVF